MYGLHAVYAVLSGWGSRVPTGAAAKLHMMRIGIIDIGSNTARLLVATVDGISVERIDEQRAHLGLGAEIERTGGLPEPKLLETASLAAEYAERAASFDVEVLDVIVTARSRPDRRPAPRTARAAEVGPQRVGEVELGVGRLPQQEVRQPLLARGADEQVELAAARACDSAAAKRCSLMSCGAKLAAAAPRSASARAAATIDSRPP